MERLTIKSASVEEYFKRGRETARRADAGVPIPKHTVLSFEDASEMLALLTPARLKLIHAVKAHPGSITSIANLLKRDRSAVKRDVDALSRFGVVLVKEEVSPGHGRRKVVWPSARKIKLEAEVF